MPLARVRSALARFFYGRAVEQERAGCAALAEAMYVPVKVGRGSKIVQWGEGYNHACREIADMIRRRGDDTQGGA